MQSVSDQRDKSGFKRRHSLCRVYKTCLINSVFLPAAHNVMLDSVLALFYGMELLRLRQLVQTEVCLGHDDTSNQDASFQTLSSYVVIILV